MALRNAWFGKGIGKASGPDSVGYTWQQPFPFNETVQRSHGRGMKLHRA